MKLDLKPRAIKLRKLGRSISDIANELKISESTASLWCRDIKLTQRQKLALEKRTQRKLEKFFALVEAQKKARDKNKQLAIIAASKELGKLSKRDIFIAGISLYWAEGFKHIKEGRIGFCNSDPKMMKFMILFLKTCLEVKPEEISPRLTINSAFKSRAKNIERFWSDQLEIPLSQFTKPFFQKTVLKKHYENERNYHGVLRIHVRKSSKLLTQMRGYLEGLQLFAERS